MVKVHKLKPLVEKMELTMNENVVDQANIDWLWYRMRNPVGRKIAFPARRGIWNGLRDNDLTKVR